MERAAIFVLAMTLGLPQARADISELQVSLRPEVVLIHRHDSIDHGLGLSGRVAFGLRDYLALEGALGCDSLRSIQEDGAERAGRTGTLVYDATRCTVGPSAALRFGAQFVSSLAVGLAYRWEHDSTRDLVSTNNVLLNHLGPTDHNALLFTVRGGIEYRLWDFLSAGVEVGSRVALAGALPELDLSIALIASFFTYP